METPYRQFRTSKFGFIPLPWKLSDQWNLKKLSRGNAEVCILVKVEWKLSSGKLFHAILGWEISDN